MSKPIIEVRNLTKRYRLGSIGATSLREEFGRAWDRLRGVPHPDPQEFWALRDVSFDIEPGEVVGVIGRNGAGKSTLLKILSRITEPTSGSARLRGRVASLLEVGTGFHPELTGRENVFLNGAILGMTRAEVRKKFDEIVAFAEVAQFIDTPVKRYSSGMYVRLAFAVAAHLDPEILIIDEVLAVGDAQFQKKCLGKMQDVSRGHGRTILFVSHNMTAVQHLCQRGVYLRQGSAVAHGPMAQIVDLYLGEASAGNDGERLAYARRSPLIEIESVELLVRGERRTTLPCGETMTLRMQFRCLSPNDFPEGIEVGFIIYGNGQKLANFWSNAGHGGPLPISHAGAITCTVPNWPFRTMPMTVQLHLNYRHEHLVDLPEALNFDSVDSDLFGTGILPHASEGIVLLPHTWSGEAQVK